MFILCNLMLLMLLINVYPLNLMPLMLVINVYPLQLNAVNVAY